MTEMLMTLEITTITTPFIMRVTVNCYLIRVADGFVMIDSGRKGNRAAIEARMRAAGCKPGTLKLIVLTHGDFDHCGNAAYLKQQLGGKITMHEADLGMVEQGDMFWNRTQPNFLVRTFMGLIARLPAEDRFTADFTVQEGDTLSDFGLDAEVIEIPGHSRGSIGLLTTNGDLFCGDLLANVGKPDMWSIIDDKAAAEISVEKLKRREIVKIYPGHGDPFPMDAFLKKSL